jgi:carotenoid cleavage dioxygenase-like enzyme
VLEFGMINGLRGPEISLRLQHDFRAGLVPVQGLREATISKPGDTLGYTLGAGRYASEAPFAPRIGSTREDDGYLVSFVTDENTGTSECILLDAAHIEDGPVCRIALPHKLCSGTHSCWADRTRLG